MSGMLLVSIHKWILSDGTCDVITVCLAYETECETCLTTPLRFAAIGVDRWLLGVWFRGLDATEPWLPLRRR